MEVFNHMTEIRLSSKSLDSNDLLTDILLFEKKWDASNDIHSSMTHIKEVIARIRTAMGGEDKAQRYDPQFDFKPLVLSHLNDALDCFYLDLAFSSTTQDVPESLLNSLSYLIHFHTGECLSMSILLNHVLSNLGFDSAITVVAHEIMLRVTLSDSEFVVIDAISGEQHTHIVESVNSVLPTEQDGDYRELDKVSLVQIFLSQQKLAFTDEHRFDKALYCIELLIQTAPDDPYQRRDRGFLLHQLDCFNLARDDFEFFIDQCPEDPAAQLLKLQLEDFEGSEHTVH